MADSYLAIAAIANDEFMIERMIACATQQAHLGNAELIMSDGINASTALAAEAWVKQNNYLWASSPSWGEKWSSALASDNPEPGKDETVITDADILSTVQVLTNPQEQSE